MREFFPENFPERVVILQNCPKGCYVTSHPSVEVGHVDETAVKDNFSTCHVYKINTLQK